MIANTDLILLDTNVLVYAYDEREGKKHERALALLDRAWLKNTHYALSVQNLSEFFTVATTKRGIDTELIAQVIEDLANFPNFIILNFNSTTVLQAILINKKTKVHYYDSLIAATMIQHNVFRIYTENTKDFNLMSGIEAVNPLA